MGALPTSHDPKRDHGRSLDALLHSAEARCVRAYSGGGNVQISSGSTVISVAVPFRSFDAFFSRHKEQRADVVFDVMICVAAAHEEGDAKGADKTSGTTAAAAPAAGAGSWVLRAKDLAGSIVERQAPVPVAGCTRAG